MKPISVSSLTISALLFASCGGSSNQTQSFKANPADYANLSCEQLEAEALQRRQVIAQTNQKISAASNKNDAGLAVGLLVSPLIGAAIAADAQNQTKELSNKSQQAGVEYKAIKISADQKGC